MINVFQPSVGEAELRAVGEVFRGNWLGHGPRSRAFEEEFAAHVGVAAEGMVFVNSGTAGLFLAVELLGLGPGDEVVLPSVSFVAAGNAVAASGARPVFCDVDARTLNPSVEDVARVVTDATRAVLVLHYGGYPGEIAGIARWCRERGLVLIEDAANAVASRAEGTACGAFGDLAVWSFDAMKILITGDGGMLHVRDPKAARRARRLAYHGLEQASGFSKAGRVPSRWWELNVQDFGRRQLGNDVTAAIGSVQLRRLPEFVERRRRIAALYDDLLAGVPGVRTPPPLPEGHNSSYYFYWVQVDAAIRDQIAADLLRQGIYTTFRYPPLHKVPAYGPYAGADLIGTEQAAETTLLLPIHQALTDGDVHTIVTALETSVAEHEAARA